MDNDDSPSSEEGTPESSDVTDDSPSEGRPAERSPTNQARNGDQTESSESGSESTEYTETDDELFDVNGSKSSTDPSAESTDDASTEDEPPSIEELGSEVKVDAEIADEIDEDDLLGGLLIDSTAEIEIPERLVDQVIGQEHARDVIIKAAKQRRHVMMIGSPGTGKSMLSKAMTELLPKEELQDVLVYHNPDDGNKPKIRTVPAGKGEQIVDAHKEEARKRNQMRTFLMWIIIAVVLGYALIIAGQILLGILAAGIVYLAFRYASRGSDAMVPNLLVNNADTKSAPFRDATGAHAGALLGDVRHDPFQSGGMETPSHDRVRAWCNPQSEQRCAVH